MSPKNLNIRMDRETGDFWIVEERYQPGQPRKIKRLLNVTGPFLLAFCADLYEIAGTKTVTRDVKFPSGAVARITAEEVKPDTPAKREKPVCNNCGSDDITCDATARWDVDTQNWELSGTFDSKTCGNCGYEKDYCDWVDLPPEGEEDGSSDGTAGSEQPDRSEGT